MDDIVDTDYGISYYYINSLEYKEYTTIIDSAKINPILYKDIANLLLKDLKYDKDSVLKHKLNYKYLSDFNFKTTDETLEFTNDLYNLKNIFLTDYCNDNKSELYDVNKELMKDYFLKKCMYIDNSAWFIYRCNFLTESMQSKYLPNFAKLVHNHWLVEEKTHYFKEVYFPFNNEEEEVNYKILPAFIDEIDKELSESLKNNADYNNEVAEFKLILEEAKKGKIDIYFYY